MDPLAYRLRIPTSIATLHDEAVAQMAIALTLITLAFGPVVGRNPHSLHDRAHGPSLGTDGSNPALSSGESYKLDDGGRSRRPTKVSASHQGRADGHAAPRFPGHGPSIDALRRSALGVGGIHVAFDVIASGDEDIVTSERTQAIRDQTGAACVAWEGSGAARAALFNGIGSLEIRAVTDAADKEAPQRFDANLPIAMANLASLLGLWLE